MQLSYKLDQFEGPLDLLLSLIAKNKLDITDIPISILLEQYMEQIQIMKNENLDIASEFLEMASRLVYIKSIALLPKHEEEQEQLKKELVGQLMEYQLCKEIAGELAKAYNPNSLTKEQENIPIDLTYKRIHDKTELLKYYFLAVGRGKRFLPPPKEKFSGIVAHRIVSVGSQIISVLKKLSKLNEITFDGLFMERSDPSERVATFLALLELIKANRIRAEGEQEDCKLVLMRGKSNTQHQFIEG